MKKQVWIQVMVFAAAVLCTAPVSIAQSQNAVADTTIDAVRLKQGGVLKGIIMELVPNERLKMLTLNGEKFGMGWGAVDSLWTEQVSGNVAMRIATLRNQTVSPEDASRIDQAKSAAATSRATSSANYLQIDNTIVQPDSMFSDPPQMFLIKLGAGFTPLMGGLNVPIGAGAFLGVQVNEHVFTLRTAYGSSQSDVALLYGRSVPIAGKAVRFSYSGGVGYLRRSEFRLNGKILWGTPLGDSFTTTSIGLATQVQLEASLSFIGVHAGVAADFGSAGSLVVATFGIQLGKLWP